MAENKNDILKKLQQYEMQAPADAFEKAWQRISEEKDWTEKKKFTQLQDFTIAPPSLDFELLKNKKKEKNTSPAYVVPLHYKRVAAILVMVAAATALYFTVFTKKDSNEQSFAETKVINDDIKPVDTAGTYVTAKDASVANNNAVVSTSTNSATKARESAAGYRNKNIANKREKGDKVTFGESNTAQVYDNDILFTLASYNGGSSKWKAFFTDAVVDKKITLNKYSWVSLSDKMVAMMQNIYSTKKNGKPTRAAKRTKKKFEKWRKNDEKYFDRNMQKNPADIIDLTDFILE